MGTKETSTETKDTTTTITTPPTETNNMPLTGDDEIRKKSLRTEINRLDNSINVASDNGLFSSKQKNVPKNACDEMQNYLKKARKYLYDGNIVESEYNTSYALREYDNALYSSIKNLAIFESICRRYLDLFGWISCGCFSILLDSNR